MLYINNRKSAGGACFSINIDMNNFDKNWRNAKVDIFRLEGRPEYKVVGEGEHIAKWKKGELNMAADKNWQSWMKSLKSAKAKKVAVQRLRVVPNPLPDYIKFEIALWQKYSVVNGEKIRFINTKDYQGIVREYGFDPKDFWLFDDEKLLMFNYGTAGQFLGDIAITDGAMVRRYCDLKQKLLEKSVPMASFVGKM